MALAVVQKSKDEVRKKVEYYIRSKKIKKKIKLEDSELLSGYSLDDLLFECLSYNGHVLKVPVWCGDFLEKIDLSRVNFNDVSWSIRHDLHLHYMYKTYKTIMPALDGEIDEYNLGMIEYLASEIPYFEGGQYYLGNTNANINFKESFEYKTRGTYSIKGITFDGTDLSNNDIDTCFTFMHTYFANTGLMITGLGESKVREKSTMFSSDITGVDLSYLTYDIRDLLEGKLLFDWKDTIRYTGIHFVSASSNMDYLDEFLRLYKNGYFDGCYINGNMTLSQVELYERKKELASRYAGKIKSRKKELGIY